MAISKAAVAVLALGASSAAAEDLTFCRQALDAQDRSEDAHVVVLLGRCIETGDLRRTSLARAHFLRANAHRRLQANAEAIADYGTAIRINPDYKDAYFHRGSLLIGVGAFAQAVSAFTEVLRLDPGDGDAHVMRGLAAHEMGEFTHAVADFTRAIAINPDDRDAYIVRARAHEALGDAERAAADRAAAAGK